VLLALLPPATLILTERGAGLSAHAGQISFPGGKPEDGDAGLLEAAQREAREEVGLEPSAFEALGTLTPVPTPTGFLIHPFVARWTGHGPRPRPSAQSDEVAAVVLAPLHELARPGVHRTRTYEWEGQRLLSHEYELPEFSAAEGEASQPATRIWGATGRITRQLLQLSEA
jgi:8-oxo-dGTP pyrophosphatase MutT (NUDIX family)